jgi:trans-aconitate methyltransferase
MNNVSETWKYSNVFEKQLAFNLKELDGSYPPHWIALVKLLKEHNPESMLDVGCGCGAIYELCKREIPELKYHGLDYAERAISLAKKTWCESCFYVKDCLSLTYEDISDYELIHMSALLDVLPNGDEVLEHVLSLSPKSVLIARMKLTNKESYYDTYTAYDEITTCAYYHNKNNFVNLCEKYGYSISSIENNFYLKKK